MNIGHARCCISPTKEEFYLIGYRAENRMHPASGIHDDIYMNAILFENNGKQVFMLSADVLEFEEDMVEDVKTLMADKYSIERDSILLCATHDHSSIVSYHKSWYTKKFDQEYYDFFVNCIMQCYETCVANKQEATAKYGKKIITGYFSNRVHEGELADNEVIVLKFFDKQGNAFAGMVNWAVHSTVISPGNTYLSADFAGNVSNKLYDDFGFYPAMIVGAAGDCSNHFDRQGKGFEELERVSSGVAKEIAQIDIDKEVELGDISYQTLFHTIHHHMEFVHAEIQSEIDKYEKKLEKETDPIQIEFIQHEIEDLSKTFDIDSFHLDAKGWVFQLGKLQLFAFPGELGSAFGIQLKENYEDLAIISGYTNGYYEYFLPASEYGLSFETVGCRVPKGEPEKMIDKYIQVSQLLKK